MQLLFSALLLKFLPGIMFNGTTVQAQMDGTINLLLTRFKWEAYEPDQQTHMSQTRQLGPLLILAH